MEVAVPNTGLDEEAAAFLADIQRGAGQSIQSAPVQKAALRVTDELAENVDTLVDAGCEYGFVSDVLDICESIFDGQPVPDDDRNILLMAATATPFVRRERARRGIDK